MATVIIGNDEARELCQVVDEKLREMRMEIAHTDDRDYREDLKRRYDRLEALQRKLTIQTSAEEVFV
jgi:hypothetical protein